MRLAIVPRPADYRGTREAYRPRNEQEINRED